ncbi:hypothetical protein BBJ28_00022665 [Nothophytophthora sp. Chile5]|nr:hypothetical protein BBJ28_00022665 [Nothophytophthora sp. Chile5]
MLALNSYGLAPRPPASNNAPSLVLPRLCGGGGLLAVREIRSLGKLDILARTPAHPLYRTTSGFDYGRYLDFKDVALSCPKHAKPTGFTKDFVAGNYADSSLLSLDNSRRRAECWQQKVATRTTQMRVKYAELQQILEEKKELRRVAREKRRREMELRRAAVMRLQACVRGFLARQALARQKLRRDTQAALLIQRVGRSRARVRLAKQELETRRRQKQHGFVVKIHRVCRGFVQRKHAKHEVMKRREERKQRALDLEQEAQRQRDNAALHIQRVARGHRTRKDLGRQYSSASGLAADKDDKDMLLSATGRARSRGARRALAQMQQVRRKRDKFMPRVQLGAPPK